MAVDTRKSNGKSSNNRGWSSNNRSSRSVSSSKSKKLSQSSQSSASSSKSFKSSTSASASSAAVKKQQKPTTSKSAPNAVTLNHKKHIKKQPYNFSASSHSTLSVQSVTKSTKSPSGVSSSRLRKSSRSTKSGMSKKSQSTHRHDDSLLITREYVSVHNAKKELFNKSKVHGQGRRRSILLNQAIEELKKSKDGSVVLEYVCIRRAESKPHYVRRLSRPEVPSGVVSPMTSRSSSFEESPSRDVDIKYLDSQFENLSLGRDADGALRYHRSNDLPAPLDRRHSQRNHTAVESEDELRPAFPRGRPRYHTASSIGGSRSSSAASAVQLSAPVLSPTAANDGGNAMVFTKNIKIQFLFNDGEPPTVADVNLDIPVTKLNPKLKVTGLYVNDRPIFHEKYEKRN